MTPFAERLADAVAQRQSQLVVGLDPDERVGDLDVFCRKIVDEVAEFAVAVKPQSAFFEARGADGVRAFWDACAYAREAGLLVIADAKRGDIASTAEAYVQAFVQRADAVTVNPYMGRDSVEPWLERGFAFCLVKTSNPGSADIQDLELADGRRVWHHVASLVQSFGEDVAGAVFGATHADDLAEARRLMPRTILLLPGIGAQGGRPEDVAAAFSAGPASALVSASRSVIYADSPAAEAKRLAAEVWAISQ